MMPRVDLNQPQAQTQRVEPSLRLNQLQIAHRAIRLLHRRPIEKLLRLDHHTLFHGINLHTRENALRRLGSKGVWTT